MRGRGLDFSFSGHEDGGADDRAAATACPSGQALADLCASFQASVVEQLAAQDARGDRAARPQAAAGGRRRRRQPRAARRAARSSREELGVELFMPSPARCTDNAAMIAAAGYWRLLRGERADLTLNATASLPLADDRSRRARADPEVRAARQEELGAELPRRRARLSRDRARLRGRRRRLGRRDRRRPRHADARLADDRRARRRRRARARHARGACAPSTAATRASRSSRPTRSPSTTRRSPRAPGEPPVVVGNLPYQIASPILFRLLETRARLARIVVMLQKEMADRIVAPPGEKAYGALSRDGAVVRRAQAGLPRARGRLRAGAARRLGGAAHRAARRAARRRRSERSREVVHAAFGQRRKTLRNALSAAFDASVVDRALGALAHRRPASRRDALGRRVRRAHEGDAMPELPEVEMVVRTLRPRLVGERISGVETSGLPLRRPIDRKRLERACVGARVESVRRVGKYLAHRSVVEARAARPPRHDRAAALRRRGRAARAAHARDFSPAKGARAALRRSAPLRRLARVRRRRGGDVARAAPCSASIRSTPAFTVDYLAKTLAASKRDIKAFLMDQSRIAGLGNIYVCEALFRAGISPKKRSDRLAKKAPRAARRHRRRARGRHREPRHQLQRLRRRRRRNRAATSTPCRSMAAKRLPAGAVAPRCVASYRPDVPRFSARAAKSRHRSKPGRRCVD